MGNRSKLRFPRFFSPFASCKSHKLLSDVIHHQKQEEKEEIIIHYLDSKEPLLPVHSPRRTPCNYPSLSICKPHCSDTTFHDMVKESCIRSVDYHKIPLSCPPASPVSPLLNHNMKKMKKKKQSTPLRKDYSSDPELIMPSRTRRKPPSVLRREARKSMADSEEKKKVMTRGTFAVVKRSSDPYTDFRASAAEMIIENNIFRVGEIEQLLHCFLSLNSPHHHRVIVHVFSDIFDALLFNRILRL